MMAALRFFRISGALEAFSFLILLLIAMPLKYVWHMPVFVQWTGRFHGGFFLLFCAAVVWTAVKRGWPARVALLAFLSAFIPFGPFLFEHKFASYLKAPDGNS